MAYDAILEGKTGLMSALMEGCYDLVPIPDAKLGPRKLDVASMYNTERYRPSYAQQARAADVSPPRVIGWQVETRSPCQRHSRRFCFQRSGSAQPKTRRANVLRACPGEVDPVRRQGHAPTRESTALPGHTGSPSDPV